MRTKQCARKQLAADERRKKKAIDNGEHPKWIMDGGAPDDWTWEMARDGNGFDALCGRGYVALASRSSDGEFWAEDENIGMYGATRGRLILDASGSGTIAASIASGPVAVVEDDDGDVAIEVQPGGSVRDGNQVGADDVDATLSLYQIQSGVRICPRLRGWDRDKDDWVIVSKTFDLPEGGILLTAWFRDGWRRGGFETIFVPDGSDGGAPSQSSTNAVTLRSSSPAPVEAEVRRELRSSKRRRE